MTPKRFYGMLAIYDLIKQEDRNTIKYLLLDKVYPNAHGFDVQLTGEVVDLTVDPKFDGIIGNYTFYSPIKHAIAAVKDEAKKLFGDEYTEE